jgi:CRISPR-associated protein Csx16
VAAHGGNADDVDAVDVAQLGAAAEDRRRHLQAHAEFAGILAAGGAPRRRLAARTQRVEGLAGFRRQLGQRGPVLRLAAPALRLVRVHADIPLARLCSPQYTENRPPWANPKLGIASPHQGRAQNLLRSRERGGIAIRSVCTMLPRISPAQQYGDPSTHSLCCQAVARGVACQKRTAHPNVGACAIRTRIGQIALDTHRRRTETTRVTTYLITRHAGAVEWARRRGIAFEHLTHLADLARIKPGDRVIGPMPLGKVADIVAAGALYLAIDMALPEGARGPELSADDMERYGARLVRYHVERMAVDG